MQKYITNVKRKIINMQKCAKIIHDTKEEEEGEEEKVS